MIKNNSLLTNEDRDLLLKVKNLIEELFETLEVLEDKDAMESIKEAEQNIKKGRLKDYKDFIEELRNSGNI